MCSDHHVAEKLRPSLPICTCHLLCLVACAALLLPSTAAQRPNCMSGIPCGQFCAPMGGSCVRGACFDASGMQVQCYAPMAPMNGGPGIFGFPPFLMFQPFAPMQPMPPMVPMVPGCGGRGPCAANQFCDPTGTGYPNRGMLACMYTKTSAAWKMCLQDWGKQ
jgi:hypothetical protein